TLVRTRDCLLSVCQRKADNGKVDVYDIRRTRRTRTAIIVKSIAAPATRKPRVRFCDNVPTEGNDLSIVADVAGLQLSVFSTETDNCRTQFSPTFFPTWWAASTTIDSMSSAKGVGQVLP